MNGTVRLVACTAVAVGVLVGCGALVAATQDLEFIVEYRVGGKNLEWSWREKLPLVHHEDNDDVAEFLLVELTPDGVLQKKVAGATGVAAAKVSIRGRRILERGSDGCTLVHRMGSTVFTTADGHTETYGVDFVEPPSPDLVRDWYVLVDVFVNGAEAAGAIYKTYDSKADAQKCAREVQAGKHRRLAVWACREIGASYGSATVTYAAEVKHSDAALAVGREVRRAVVGRRLALE